jgi:hypothetical protein
MRRIINTPHTTPASTHHTRREQGRKHLQRASKGSLQDTHMRTGSVGTQDRDELRETILLPHTVAAQSFVRCRWWWCHDCLQPSY